MKYAHRPTPYAPPLRLDYAPRNRRRPSRGHRIGALLMVLAFGLLVFLLARQALAQPQVVAALCDSNGDCWERYCAQDMSCDAPEPPTFAVQP